VFGHYEDADLCLKSIQRGTVPWIHDIQLWHLEGQGSHRLPVHEGGSLANRWLFTTTWSEQVSDGLLGPDPSHPIMRRPLAEAATDCSSLASTPPWPAARASGGGRAATGKSRSQGSAKSASAHRPVPANGAA